MEALDSERRWQPEPSPFEARSKRVLLPVFGEPSLHLPAECLELLQGREVHLVKVVNPFASIDGLLATLAWHLEYLDGHTDLCSKALDAALAKMRAQVAMLARSLVFNGLNVVWSVRCTQGKSDIGETIAYAKQAAIDTVAVVVPERSGPTARRGLKAAKQVARELGRPLLVFHDLRSRG